MEILRKTYEEKRINWVEALPQTLDRYHDVPNLSGLTPYQIVFGRHRPLGNVPYVPEDARDFFARMKEVDFGSESEVERIARRGGSQNEESAQGFFGFPCGRSGLVSSARKEWSQT